MDDPSAYGVRVVIRPLLHRVITQDDGAGPFHPLRKPQQAAVHQAFLTHLLQSTMTDSS